MIGDESEQTGFDEVVFGEEILYCEESEQDKIPVPEALFEKF